LNSKAPIFTRDFVLVCLATLLSGSVQSLVLTAIPLLLKQLGFAAGFVGGFLGAFAMCALIARFPVGGAVDRFGSRAFGAGGAGLLSVACVLYVLVPLVPARTPFAAAVPLLLPLAGIAHSVGFSTYGTAASSFVAYTVPPTRRGEAVGYYGILKNIATGIAAGLRDPEKHRHGHSGRCEPADRRGLGLLSSSRDGRGHGRAGGGPVVEPPRRSADRG
jgi:MFS family permease